VLEKGLPVLAMNSTLLVGPADWSPARMPKEEFLARATALWRGARAASGAIVYGDRAHHAELAYLTHFTPKLEAALALIPRVGAPRLLVGGGVNMMQAAKPLTFIEGVQPLRNVGATVAQWAREQSGGGRPVLVGGALMPHALHRELVEAVGTIADKTADVRTLMRRKSPRELGAIREACATLDAAVAAMHEARRSGTGATATVLAGEHAAHRRGAQDVRTLFSLDGGCTLRPFEIPVERAVDPLHVYVAVRQLGYWAEGFAAVTAAPDPYVEGAGEVLQHAIAMIVPGRRCGDVARGIGDAIQPMQPHPITAQAHGNAIGLALEERPIITTESGDSFEDGDVYSLRVGITHGSHHAIASAMVAVHQQGCDVLWSSPGAVP
jgi:Xaa-Pro aminopeptidase